MPSILSAVFLKKKTDFRERRGERRHQRERGTSIGCLLKVLPLGIESTMWVCALAMNRGRGISVCGKIEPHRPGHLSSVFYGKNHTDTVPQIFYKTSCKALNSLSFHVSVYLLTLVPLPASNMGWSACLSSQCLIRSTSKQDHRMNNKKASVMHWYSLIHTWVLLFSNSFPNQ